MIKLALVGDVMLGRGIDQILPHPGNPHLYEHYLQSAQDYVHLAERASGPIPRGASFDYVWGDAAHALRQEKADFTIVNLETAVTNAGEPEPKGINYRMNPRNAGVLQRLPVDCCVLANNHVLDWGEEGLLQTIDTLHGLRIPVAGVGRDAAGAAAPAILRRKNGGRVLVFAFATRDSGVPHRWAAGPNKPGVNHLDRLDGTGVEAIAAQVAAVKSAGDVVVASIHWGGDWGYEIPPGHVSFAHALIEVAGIDVVHGHSSHHARGFEVHRGKLILYGCGDFLNDYEGIRGYEEFRVDLALLYLPVLDDREGGTLASLRIVPFQIRNLRLNRASETDAHWLAATLTRHCLTPGMRLVVEPDATLHLQRG
jgi:poly-gamma-glutamate synthesis protein (capsule biosynthesis protein)